MRRHVVHGGRASSPVLRQAAALALGAAVSLGLARFSYALLLPPMRADLGWSYLTAGMMNTVNALGYLFGALLVPRLLRRYSPRGLLLAGSAATAALLAAHGLVLGEGALLLLRLGSGMASAFSFVCGGLLAARLGSAPGDSVAHGAHPPAALVLGLYYGGTGLGIIVSAAIVPPLADLARPHAWQYAWVALAAVALLATAQMAAGTRALPLPSPGTVGKARFALRRFAYALAAYLMFGLGYIGYMTFNITLLREQGMASGGVTLFYLVLGLGVVVSSWLWADLLQRHRGGVPMAVLNGLLALATALPVLSQHVAAAFLSAALFGSVFLSVVASTTALVRHNADPAAWPAGIAAFTIVFAFGQIVGPVLVGWVADGPGGLVAGFACSAAALALGALLAWRQQALVPTPR
ncbi:MAG: YbfB/YjiJ family MFS transporter [Rubrivivax sp.]